MDLYDLKTIIQNSFSYDEIRQGTLNTDSPNLAGTIIVYQTKDPTFQNPFPLINRDDIGKGTLNDSQRSETSSWQYGRFPSGPVINLDRYRVINEEMMKKTAVVILTEVIAFSMKENKSVAFAKSIKECLTIMLSLICRENLVASTTSKLLNIALTKTIVHHRRYQII
ncbi:MAG: hypothetical protein EZS28_034845 [Streblomastix strix]|uniref:Uncharacterized protein n=1 Tax=Streblomastix strix TaxID=222440 RepID=A0A5J4UGV1_9EUKA|nr:MAG: hypothetical protein EZS28_034845 [Streblomastix strix]